MLGVEVVFALAFVQLANAETAACLDAQATLFTNATCLQALSGGTDVGTICMGSCRTLVNDIINNCDAAETIAYSSVINNLCNGTSTSGLCANAISGISPTCLASLNSSNTSVCTGTCGTQLTAVVTACDNNATTYSTLIKNLCNGTNTSGVCANAISGISPTCLASLNSSNKSVCTGTCGTQLTAVVTACDNNATTYSTLIKNLCNGTSTGGVCANANSSINPTCLASLNGSDTSACTRTCGTQLAALVTACDNIDQQTQLTLSAYDTLCGGTTICLAATIAVYIDTSCTAALESEDAGSLCSGSCRSSFNLLFNACPDDDDTIATTRVEYYRLCAPVDCTNAISNISSTCSEAFNNGDSLACIGACKTEIDEAVSACNVTNSNFTQAEAFFYQYNTLCSSACIAAQSAIADDGALCLETAVCSGTCRALVDAVMNACPVNDDAIFEFNLICGSSGIMVMASGITLLIAVVCVLTLH